MKLCATCHIAIFKPLRGVCHTRNIVGSVMVDFGVLSPDGTMGKPKN